MTSKTFRPALFTALLCGALGAPALTAPAFAAEPAKTADTAKGPTLVNAKGMTLYMFAKDMDGKSACTGKCAANWPPLKAGKDAMAMGEWTVVVRDDGTRQWAYKGHPLYTWSKDKKPGDITGDGFLEGAWSVAQP